MGLFRQNKNPSPFNVNTTQKTGVLEPSSVGQTTTHSTDGRDLEPDFEPIAGVSIDTYVAISKGLAAYNYDQSRAEEVAITHGVDCFSWQEACDGWNARMRRNRAVAQRFNALYTGRA